jgi:GNAT superfamily N-acetyltransferase
MPPNIVMDDDPAGLYLREDFPRLVEIGTVYIDPQYQGRGLNPVMQNELLSTIQEEIEAKRLLAMLTTKTQKVVNSFNRAEELGMNRLESQKSMLAGL